MAMKVDVNEYGADVAKDWLDICEGSQVIRIDTQQDAIKAFIKTLPASSTIAIDSTNNYHELMVELAFAAKHTVYLIDGYRLSRYRNAVCMRDKTDANDAQLLRRYLRFEKRQLIAFNPIPKPLNA